VKGKQEEVASSDNLQNPKELRSATNDALDDKFQVLGVSDKPGEIQVTEAHKESSVNPSALALDMAADALGEAVASFDPFFDTDDEALSLTPSSEQLDALDLQPGPNTLRFIVETSAAEISCRIFLWDNDAKIVISDVDGTITRSDVLGHVLPAVGRDWSHVGVAGLYTEIAKRGYKFMYLTARPIGQASQTRSFLHNVIQGGSRLPNGPVLMSPNRLVESFTREVIRRKPQEFKIDALRKVRNLFPPDYNPFHAGFGNRETDVISYRAVGLIPQRIFVVNPQAELAVMNVRYESTSSYSSLRELVDNVFLDIHGMKGPAHEALWARIHSTRCNSQPPNRI
jgi:phosphatidate phosphatase PAH1